MDEDDELNEPTPEELEVLNAKIAKLEEVGRKVGVYLDRALVTDMPTPFGSRRVIVAEFTLGDVAFAKRVQDPEQTKVDQQFREMTHGFGTDEFLDARERVRKNLAEGRSLFDRRRDDEA